MKEEASAEQLRSLSDRDNPFQEHAKTLRKVNKHYKTCISWRTCGTTVAADLKARNHGKHPMSGAQFGNLLCMTPPSLTEIASLTNLTANRNTLSQAEARLVSPTSILQQLSCTLFPDSREKFCQK